MTYGGATYGGATYGGTGNVQTVLTLTATPALETSTVQTATLDPSSATLAATLATETSTVQSATLNEIHRLIATTAAETSTVQSATLAPQSATLAGSTALETSAVQSADITGAGTATLTATTGSETTTVQSATAAPQSVSLAATTGTETSTVQSALALPQTATLAASVGTETSTVQSAIIGFLNWVIGGEQLTTVTGETSTARTLTLQPRVTTDTLEATLRPLKTDEGKVDVLGTDDGGFVAIDRADGGNSFSIIPPVTRQPLRQSGTVHVARYEEDLVSQAVGEWDVTLELTRDADRTDTPSISQTPAADEWGITTRYGEIATSRVDAEVVGTGEGGVQQFELLTRLTDEQAHAFEAALSQLGAGRVRNVPDAPNVAVDDTSGNVATVTLDTPDSQTVVGDGDYVVTEWESTRLTDAYQEVSVTVAKK